MKKLFTFLTVFVFFLLPFGVFAAVDISLTDVSTEDSNSISVRIDTQTDVLEQVMLPIRFSAGVTVNEITEGDIECSTLEFSDSIDNVIIINCDLEEATALNGILANISFTTTEIAYSFEVLEENENLDIGDLILGDVVNIGQADQADLIENEVPFENEEGDFQFEDDTIVTTQEGFPLEEESGFSIDNITEYLPYILIAGSVILLISIVAIILGKKKDSKGPKDPAPTTPPEKTSPEPPAQQDAPQEQQEEPTLKSMVNNVDNTTQPAPTPTPAPQATPPQQEPSQEPPQQKTSSPEIAPKTEEEDLQEILQREGGQNPPNVNQESAQTNQVPFNNNLNNTVPENPTATTPPPASPTPQPQPPQTPSENPETYMQNNPVIKQPDNELQQNVAGDIDQIKRTSPPTDAPGVAPQVQGGQSTQQTDTPTTEGYPPVPGNARPSEEDNNTQGMPQQPPVL